MGLEPAGIDLNAFISDVEGPIRQTLPRQVQLTVHIEPSLPLIKSGNHKHENIRQLRLVIEALVQDAIEAMPNGGRVAIETSNA
jgi:signal transduction histidine kinase